MFLFQESQQQRCSNFGANLCWRSFLVVLLLTTVHIIAAHLLTVSQACFIGNDMLFEVHVTLIQFAGLTSRFIQATLATAQESVHRHGWAAPLEADLNPVGNHQHRQRLLEFSQLMKLISAPLRYLYKKIQPVMRRRHPAVEGQAGTRRLSAAISASRVL